MINSQDFQSDGGDIAEVKGYARLANATCVEMPSSGQFCPDSLTLSAADGQRGIPSSSPGCVKNHGRQSVAGQGRESGCQAMGSKEEQAVNSIYPASPVMNERVAA